MPSTFEDGGIVLMLSSSLIVPHASQVCVQKVHRLYVRTKLTSQGRNHNAHKRADMRSPDCIRRNDANFVQKSSSCPIQDPLNTLRRRRVNAKPIRDRLGQHYALKEHG